MEHPLIELRSHSQNRAASSPDTEGSKPDPALELVLNLLAERLGCEGDRCTFFSTLHPGRVGLLLGDRQLCEDPIRGFVSRSLLDVERLCIDWQVLERAARGRFTELQLLMNLLATDRLEIAVSEDLVRSSDFRKEFEVIAADLSWAGFRSARACAGVGLTADRQFFISLSYVNLAGGGVKPARKRPEPSVVRFDRKRPGFA